MKQKLLILASVLTLALSATPEAGAQWVHTTVTGGGLCFASLGSKLFVGTAYGIDCSTDSGITWNPSNNGLPSNSEYVTDVNAFAVNGTILAAGTLDYGVYMSTDSGANWKAANTGIATTDILGMIFLGTNLFASSGGLLLSTDSGASWSSADSGLPSNDNDYIRAFAVSDENLFAGTTGGVFLTTDSGTYWTISSSGLPSGTYFISFAVIGSTMFAGTNLGGGVFLSTNNGNSWSSINTGLPSNTTVYALAMSDSNLFAGVNGEGVYLSTNKGTSWQDVNTGLGDWNLRTLYVFGGNLFAGTDSGVWYRPLSQMIGTSSVTQNPSMQSSFTAYPNPLTQSTTITFTSPESGAAEITVVNLLGAEVARIYSGEMDAGTHSFTWNASALPPGTYWCEIRMNGTASQIPVVVQR